jgi:hypothetical protein
MGQLPQQKVDDLLGPADRPHRAIGQSSGQPIYLLIELVDLHDVVDQPDKLGLRGGHQVAGEQILFGAQTRRAVARSTRPRHHEAGVDMRITNLGVVGHDDNVNRRAKSDGMAIDPRDDRVVVSGQWGR